jgi:acyl-coenzyme A synthetase/AMP-(fatty) acid ligase
LFLAGERADPDTVLWAEERLGVPVIDHWWQTETGWCDRRQSGWPRPCSPVKYGISHRRHARL